MSAATFNLQATDALRPQPPGGMGRGALLAIAVHGLLVVALALSVSWRSQTPQTFSAELWAATPQVAAPRAVESTPVAPPPPPPPPPPAPAPRVAPPPPAPAVDAKIAIEKAREEKLKIEREQAQREKLERDKLAKAERERLERERQRDAKAKADAQQREQQAKREQQEQRDKQAAAQAEEQRLAKQREDNLKRMLGQAGATGAPGSTGTALKDAAPSASYAGKLIARIKPNILLTDPVSGNPSADVEVRASPTGSILSRRLVKPSGNKDWDDAVLRAIDRTAELPRDTDGRVPPVLVISFTPSP